MEVDFPELNYSFDDEKRLLTIPPIHDEVGELCIQDDEDELTIFVGNFTHWHCNSWDDDLTDLEKETEIVDDVAGWLECLLSDKIFMWGSHEKGGGCEGIDESFTPKRQGYVWSGPYSS